MCCYEFLKLSSQKSSLSLILTNHHLIGVQQLMQVLSREHYYGLGVLTCWRRQPNIANTSEHSIHAAPLNLETRSPQWRTMYVYCLFCNVGANLLLTSMIVPWSVIGEKAFWNRLVLLKGNFFPLYSWNINAKKNKRSTQLSLTCRSLPSSPATTGLVLMRLNESEAFWDS